VMAILFNLHLSRSNELEVSAAVDAHLHCSPSLLPMGECGIFFG
jgi:hypothetical protein